MKRWGLWLALFLSLGFNLGLLVSRWAPSPLRPALETADRGAEGRDAENVDAADWPRRVPPRLERMVVRLANDLGLEGNKREQFFDLQRDYFRRTLRARHQVRRLEHEVRRQLLRNEAERAEVEAILTQLVGAKAQVEQAFLDHYFAARELLDEPQMQRYQRFLGQLRRVSEELARRPRPGATP